MSALDMDGFVDDDLKSVTANKYGQSGARDAKGRWVAAAEDAVIPYDVNLQPLSDKELTNLGAGGERIQDFRKFYVNKGDLFSLTPQDEWEFDTPDLAGVRFTTYAMDNRPWRNYCKCVVARNDR
jgi:hypothetical protein